MAFSSFLESRRPFAKALVSLLLQDFAYVSVLGNDTISKSLWVNRTSSGIEPGFDTDCGFVIKVHNGGVFFEYSLDDLSGTPEALARKIKEAFCVHALFADKTIHPTIPADEPLVSDFARPHDLSAHTDADLLDFCKTQRNLLLNQSDNLVNLYVKLTTREVSSLFVSGNRELTQNFAWVNGVFLGIYKENDRTVTVHEGANGPTIAAVIEKLPQKGAKLLHTAHYLTLAEPIQPGVYDVITDYSISGLIAHEAFGHGVEMDQFVKDRALAKSFVGKRVASDLCNMSDGAAAVTSAGSYFFDDDGELAGDTAIIRDGILLSGICDMASAAQLGTVSTGNGRRESHRRKAYARMTNTFFEPGQDRLEDMIASVDHGYMLFECDNGMEDPKNWAIQCVAQYGIEIIDGKLTDHYVAPVVMTGYVPDLLRSISMVSNEAHVFGSGMCGKGYKEWVRVSDGGPALKVKVKLG